MNYLTEEKLGRILKELFCHSEIIPQYKYGKRRVDYGIIVDPRDSRPQFEEFYEDGEDEDYEYPKTLLLIEFDGFLHYTTTSNVIKDQKGQEDKLSANWSRVDEGVFQLRIPYWIQLDEKMTDYWFQIKLDFSDNFPQGFISKNVRLPEMFSTEGENRFVDEMLGLPKEISEQVYSSLLKKLHEKPIERVASLHLWKRLIELFDQKRGEEIKDDVLSDVLVASVIKNEYISKSSFELICKEEETLNKSIYKLYLEDNGVHNYKQFKVKLRKFFKITQSLIDSDSSKNECVKNWVNYIGSVKEAERFFRAVDRFNGYS